MVVKSSRDVTNKQRLNKWNKYDSTSSYDSMRKDVKIPKIIMQTWKNRKIPKKWLSSVESIKEYMPTWEHVIMTDEDNRKFVKTHFPKFLPYYDKFPHPIQRADAIRVCWLYIKGGIYMDLDIEILKPLDPLFTKSFDICFVNSGNCSSYTTNSFMACQPKHPIWLEYIEKMKQPTSKWAMDKHFTVMTTTGPMALTDILHNTKHPYVLLPSKLLTPCSVCDIRCKVTSETYLKPLQGGSWNAWDSRLLNFLLCHWKKVIIAVIILLIILIILYIYNR